LETNSLASNGAFQLLLFVAVLIPAILFLLTEFNTLRLIKRENRAMQPGWVWLQLVPLFGQIWQFVVVARIANSIRNQWQAADEGSILGIDAEAAAGDLTRKPTLAIGLVYCALNAIMVGTNFVATFDHVDSLVIWVGFFAIASMACWIVYWVVLAVWKRRLKKRVTRAI
jgi:hypothetical protein